MSGTRAGGLLAREKNLASNPNFYADIGRKGGRLGTTGGFGEGEAGRERARLAGYKGGRISRRGKSKLNKANTNE